MEILEVASQISVAPGDLFSSVLLDRTSLTVPGFFHSDSDPELTNSPLEEQVLSGTHLEILQHFISRFLKPLQFSAVQFLQDFKKDKQNLKTDGQ